MEGLLLRELHFLRVEALCVGHLSVELGQVEQCVDLIGEQYRLLLMHVFLVCRYPYEEVVGKPSGAGRAVAGFHFFIFVIGRTARR